MGINEREYMRRRDPEPDDVPQTTIKWGAILALCIVVSLVMIGSAIRDGLSTSQPEIEEIDIKEMAAMQRPPSEPPASIKRQVDINTATAEELDTLPYVGETTATSIITHRPYKSIDDLEKVPHISKWKIEEMRPYIMAIDPE